MLIEGNHCEISTFRSFCEIISGLFLCSAFAGLFLLLGILTQAQLSSLCTVAFKLSSLPALLLAFYIAGILFDPVGMLVDNLIEKTLSVSSCSAEEKGIYYAYAPEHLVAYRHETRVIIFASETFYF